MDIHKVGNHPLQTVGVIHDQSSTRWVVFIHGGAWRDPNNTLHDCDAWLANLQGVSKASLSYRLSPEFKHPTHINDVLDGLRYIDSKFTVDEIVLVGHSAGAFLSLQVAEYAEPEINCKISTIFAVEPIVSLVELEEENPSYADFVIEAFGDNRDEWKELSPTECTKNLIVVYSPEDELLNADYQPQLAMTLNANAKYVETKGKHDEVVRSESLGPLIQSLL